MRYLITSILFSIISTISGFSQTCLESTNTYEHLFETYDYSVCVTESSDSNYHMVVLKNRFSKNSDTIINSLQGGFEPNRIAKVDFIDSVNFVIIYETLSYPYSLIYCVADISDKRINFFFREDIILNNKIKRNPNNAYGRKGSEYYEVVSPTHIKILDRGKPIALLHFDLEHKKFIRTEIKRE